MSPTDAELIQRWSRGQDAEAFRELVHRHAPMVFATSRRILGNAADAEDLTQECFLKLCQLRQPAHNLPAWLHRVVTCGAIDMLRARSRRRQAEERWEPPRLASGEVTWREVEPFVDEAIDALPEKVRAPLVLYYLENRTQTSIAESLGVSQATVSHRLRKGVELIRRRLRRRGLALAPAVLSGWLSARGAEAAPATLLARLGKAAVLGHGAGTPRAAAAFSMTQASRTSILGGWTMKIAVASIAGILLAGALALFVVPSSRSPEPAARDLTAAPAPVPSTGPAAQAPAAPPATPRRDEPPPPSPVKRPAVVGGSLRDESGEPIAFADVYLAMHPPSGEDFEAWFLRADYLQRSRFVQTKSDGEGRYAFDRVPGSGIATLSAFQEGYSGGLKSVRVDEGSAPEVDLVLANGETLAGRVLAVDGSPVADAVVSILGAWSPTSHVFKGAGLGPTGADGRFRLGLGEATTACHVRVSSDSHGQDFFLEVAVTDEEAALTLKELGRVEGTITWADGTPATGLTVRASGRLPEPPIPVDRLGRRPDVVYDGLVGGDGAYVIDGLYPRLEYDIFVIDSSLGKRQALMRPLSPRRRNAFVVEAGEVKVWDQAVPRPITIRGRIRTEASGKPLPRGRVGVRKDGKSLTAVFAEADVEGSYTLHLNSGPGDYVVHAEPPGDSPALEEVGDLIAERFGRALQLKESEEVELDLTIFEPVVLPVRVVDFRGEPVRSTRRQLRVTFPNGQKMAHEAPCVLDETGRTTFPLYFPAAEFWFEIGAFPGKPTTETRRYAGQPGAVLPEETVILPPACDLRAVVFGALGNAYVERPVYLRVVYDDGSKEDFTVQTDKQGVLDAKGRVRAAAFVIELRSAESNAAWKSQRLDGSAGEVIELGEIVLE